MRKRITLILISCVSALILGAAPAAAQDCVQVLQYKYCL